MKIHIKRSHIGLYEKIYYILWTAFALAFFFLQQSEIMYMYSVSGLYHDIVKVIAICLFGLLLSTNRYKMKVFVLYLMVGIVFGISTFVLRDSYLFVACAFIIAGTKIDFDQFVKYDIKLKILIIVTVIGLCSAGFLNNYTATINGAYKQGLGFSHPNGLSALVITVMIEWIYIRYEKFNLLDFIGVLICVAWTNSVAASRSSIYTFVFVFLIMLISKIYPRIFRFRIIDELFALLTLLSAGLSFGLMKLYSDGTAIGIVLDDIFTHRIKHAYLLVQQYGLSLFGQGILVKGTRDAVTSTADLWSVDMAYIAIPVRYGIFLLILLFVGYYIMNKKAIADRRYNLVIAMAFFSLFGVGETYIYRIQYNFTLMVLLSYARSVPQLGQRDISIKQGNLYIDQQHYFKNGNEIDEEKQH